MKTRKPRDTFQKQAPPRRDRSKYEEVPSSRHSPAEIAAVKHFFEAGRSPSWPETALQQRMQSSGG
jgi:hypothetical protein